ncbi:MAG TPA: cobyrinic acid a,c-diamide synthase [Bacteroidales bacterium]|jgi:MinD superfamily P-loop ATPase|nr:cobyrinic acid a,c-diamide synthase [Bacteroidales bacterium]
MPYKIAIASGKGGTGKTTIAVNLYSMLNKVFANRIELVDCDVEEPNDLIFFEGAYKEKQEEIFQLIPNIDKDKCTFCRECAEYCEFNAIVVIPPANFAEVNKSLCHSCGACLVACKHEAISEYPETIGWVNSYQTKNVNGLKEGRLKIGSAMQTMLIKDLKKRVSQNTEIVVYDSPPGTSCPVVETISDANYVILVTEPTLFGLHDLKLMVNLMKEVKIPFGAIVNKAGLGNNAVYEYLKSEGIELLGEIPFSREYAGIYAKGNIVENMPDFIQVNYEKIVENLSHKLIKYEGDNYFKW